MRRFGEEDVEFASVHQVREHPEVPRKEGAEDGVGREEDPEEKEGLLFSPSGQGGDV